MIAIIVVVVILVLAYLWFTKNPKSDDKPSAKENMIITKIKNGDYNLGTEDPLMDYLILRQRLNFYGTITNTDLS